MGLLRAVAGMVVQWARTAVRRVARYLPVLGELVLGGSIVLGELVLDRSIVPVDSIGIEVLQRRKKEFGGWMLSLGWDRTL